MIVYPALISHASKVMLKFLQARLQQYVNQELPDVKAGFRKGRGTRDQIVNIRWIIVEKAMATRSSTLAWKIPWVEKPDRLQFTGSQLSDFTFTFHFRALEKEMATYSSVLAWRIPGMGEPGGLPSMGPHRVGHD